MNVSGLNHPVILSASTMIGDNVTNSRGDDLGKLEEIMIDLETGQVAYAVLSFGGFIGFGDKLFAIPWEALSLDTENKEFLLEIPEEMLEDAPGFDKDNWPGTRDRDYMLEVYTYYDYEPYWKQAYYLDK